MAADSNTLTIRWRGPLSSCNYDCSYCPFAKTRDSRQTLATDRAALARFCDWVRSRNRQIAVLFTPWGEGLIRRHYRQAMIDLSQADNVSTVAIQTNLSTDMDWVDQCRVERIAFWATYHPDQADRDRFLKHVQSLHQRGIRLSVGAVACREHFDEIERLRHDLPAAVYLWINAEESIQGCYADDEIERLVEIDPLFELNNVAYASRGRPCSAGHTSISVSGDGSARPCHFVDRVIGNIYDANFERALMPNDCPKASCNCYIGYSNLNELGFEQIYPSGVIERRAANPTRTQAQASLTRFGAKG